LANKAAISFDPIVLAAMSAKPQAQFVFVDITIGDFFAITGGITCWFKAACYLAESLAIFKDCFCKTVAWRLDHGWFLGIAEAEECRVA
jgi:hypothetical protein